MNIGYACLTIGVPNTDFKSCIMKNASETKILELIKHNLSSLENVIDYNIKNNIRMFRISSDLIPFGSSPVNSLPWWNIFDTQLIKIREKIKASGMRVSMHPGQYTILNSPNEDVVERAVKDLKYHTQVLNSLGLGQEHKIVLHIGGVYNDKKQAVERFILNYHQLDESVKRRLVLENDDKSYNICDVLEMGMILNAPVIFDNLHNEINPYDKQKSDFYWIDACRKTWKTEDGNQKIHYSQQDPLKKPGSHSKSIGINKFMDFYNSIKRDDVDIMLEVKDKNLSAIKCIQCTTNEETIKVLEMEWSRYKYKIMENSPSDYVAIRKLLQNKKEYSAIGFYQIIESAMRKEASIGNFVNAAQHVWGYFKEIASDKEKINFFKSIELYQQGQTSARAIKIFLWKMTTAYKQNYLMDSYYFID